MQPIDLKKFPDFEARTPRESFTARLRKLCAKLDGESTKVVSFKHFHGAPRQAELSAKRLWVFGSYARGALTCGDLDLLMEVEGRAPRELARRAFIGPLVNVRTLFGTPEENITEKVIQEAVLVWEPGMDWETALRSIAVDPEAGRLARPTDALPFRHEQDGLPLDDREVLLELRNQGVLSWRFLPLSTLELHQEPEKSEKLHGDEDWVIGSYGQRSAEKRRLTPVLMGFARKIAQEKCPGARVEWGSNNRHIRVGGTLIQVGSFDIDLSELLRYSATGLAFIPPLSTRGPNGVWLIERGPSHPMVKAFAGVKAWVFKNQEGGVPLVYPRQVGVRSSTGAKGLELFTTQLDAQRCANLLYQEDIGAGREARRCHAALIEGPELLESLARADLLFPSFIHAVPLTHRGETYLADHHDHTKMPKVAELVKIFKSRFEPNGPAGLEG